MGGGAIAIAIASASSSVLNNNNSSHLSKGSYVEVSTDEEGFQGAWFVATVLDPPSSSPPTHRSAPKRTTPNTNNHKNKKKHLVYVQYHSLLAEDGSTPLREHAEVSFVRPTPPSDSDPTPNFGLNDVVDAYYCDGWWTGVITSVIEDSNSNSYSRFVVTFQNPPDEIEFGISELRVHREWRDGKWVQPEKQRTAGLMFSAGKKVEVSFEKEDCCEVWFPATVLEDTGHGSFTVECQRQGVDDEEAGLHQVTVDYLNIRPSPPHLRDKSFVLLEKVDAFYDFGWWSGVITKELADSRYIVFFKHTNKEKEFNHSELRPHMDWKDGKWFSASQRQILSPEERERRIMSFPSMLCMWHKDVLIPSDNQGRMGHVGNIANGGDMAVSHGMSGAMQGGSGLETPALNSMENKIEQTTPCIEKQSHLVTSPKNIKQTNLVNDATNSSASKKLKEANVANALCQLSTYPSLVPSQETVVGYTSPTTGYVDTRSSEEPMASDQLSTKTESFSHGKKVRSKRGKGGEPNKQPISLVKKPGRPPKSPQRSVPKSPQASIDDSAEKAAEDIVNIPVVIGLESNGMKNARAKKTQHLASPKSSLKQTSGQKEQLVDSHTPISVKSKEGNTSDGGVVNTQKRKRGRPPKVLAQIPDTSTAVNKQNGDVASYQTATEDCIKHEVGSPTSVGIESLQKEDPIPDKERLKPAGDNTSKQKSTLSTVMKISLSKNKLPQEKKAQASTEQPKKHSSAKGKRGRRRTISVNTESLNPDSQDVSKEKVDEGSEKDGPTRKDDMAVDVLPSTMSDDQPLSMWFEGMHSPTIVDFSAPGAALGGRTEEQHIEPSEREKVVSQAPPGGDTQNLPFVKNTPLWETIASMEVFRMIPQKPHFRPLDGCKESSREGLAIGSMVTFASVVEKTSALQFDNPRSTIEDNLETLVELESHGFDVKVVRDRLMGLLLVKDKQEELQNQSNEIRSRIVEHTREESKIDEEMDQINQQIRELEEKRSLAMSRKEIKMSEITSLEKTVVGIIEGISTSRLEFDKLAAAPWQV